MAIKYADQALCLKDPDGRVQAFMDAYQPLEDLRQWSTPTWALSSRRHPRSAVRERSGGIAVPNYPAPPKLRLNELYWPTGAGRWAYFVGLASKTIKDAVVATAYANGNDAQTLVLETNQGDAIQTEMHLLQPRPVSCTDGETLWLLPLVDERYYWQWKNTGNLTLTTGTGSTTTGKSWAVVLEELSVLLTAGTWLGAGTVAAAYGKPDTVECTRRYDNAAMLMDALCHSIGKRLIRTLEGNLQAQGFGIAEGLEDGNKERSFQQIAGDDYSSVGGAAVVPGQVDLLCRKAVYHGVCDSVYLKTKEGGDYIEFNAPSLMETQHAIFTTAVADFTDGTQATATNDSAIDGLAGQVATDLYDSLTRRYDFTIVGLLNWEPTAFNDHILWRVGTDLPPVTRAVTPPVNFGIVEMLHQLDDYVIYDSPARFELTAALATGVSETAMGVFMRSYPDAPTSIATTSDLIQVTPGHIRDWAIASGKRGWAEFKLDAERWESFQAECPD